MPVIDLLNDQLITISQAARRLPRKPSPPTIWRWRTKGIRGVKLECVYAGGQWLTTPEAFAAFLRASSAAAMLEPDPPTERPEATRRRLEAAGLV